MYIKFYTVDSNSLISKLTDFRNVDAGSEGGNLYPDLLKQLGFSGLSRSWYCKPGSAANLC
jgi:hypothetical protein